MKKIAFCLLLSCSTVFAGGFGPLCQKSDGLVGGTNFYKTFVLNDSLEYTFVSLYKRIDKDILNYLLDNCPRSPNGDIATNFDKDQMDEFLNGYSELCKQSCASHVNDFYSDPLVFLKKTKIKKTTNECLSVCNQDVSSQRELLRQM